jgi:hypothetical protein
MQVRSGLNGWSCRSICCSVQGLATRFAVLMLPEERTKGHGPMMEVGGADLEQT